MINLSPLSFFGETPPRKANISRRWAKEQTPRTIYTIHHKIVILPLTGITCSALRYLASRPTAPRGKGQSPLSHSAPTQSIGHSTPPTEAERTVKEPQPWSQTDWGRLRLCYLPAIRPGGH